jgi:hypothetical protein
MTVRGSSASPRELEGHPSETETLLWRKANASGAAGCVEVAWRTARASGSGNCVEVGWRKASTSAADCVEVRPGLHRSGGDCVFVRDSKDKSGPVLVFTAHEWACFLDAVRKGEFDYLVAQSDR